MGITELSERLARRRLRVPESDYDILNVKGAKNLMTDFLSRTPTDGEITVQIDEDISCFIAEPENPDESVGGDDSRSLATRNTKNIFELKLSQQSCPLPLYRLNLFVSKASTCFVEWFALLSRRGKTTAKKSRRTSYSKTRKAPSAERLTSMALCSTQLQLCLLKGCCTSLTILGPPVISGGRQLFHIQRKK